MKYKYSVIIPHKNSPKLLQRCLDSIPKREDIQIIVIDDNSDTDKVDFDRFPGKDCNNIEIIFTKEGKGAGYARNVGLDASEGQWIIFSDADDFFYENAFNKLDSFVNSNLDIIFFYCNSRYGETNELAPDRVRGLLESIKSHNFDYLRYKTDVPWGKMIQKKIIDKYQLRFEETPVANDVAFGIRVGHYSEKIGILEEPLYCATRNSDSLYFKQTPERIFVRMNVAIRKNQFLKDVGKEQYSIDTLKFAMKLYPCCPLLFFKAIIKCKQDTPLISYFREVIRQIYRIERKRLKL